MYLSIATTHRPATDLGYLLHKHPDRVHTTELGFGSAVVVYPEANETRCEAALLLDVDPIALVRGRGSADGRFDHYVNDRPYAATSFLSVALNKVFRTAMTGTSKERPDLAEAWLPLQAVVTPLPARDGPDLVHALFEPLGWTVDAEPIRGPDRAPSPYVRLQLTGAARLSTLLTQLYVLIPVLDDAKHYWVDEAEIDKLFARGDGWLATHPAVDLITRRYLRHQRGLARLARARLGPEDAATDAVGDRPMAEADLEAPIRLHDIRLDRVAEVLAETGAETVADLGCGEGQLIGRLLVRGARHIVGLDPDTRALEKAARRLRLGEFGGPANVTLLHGSLTYRDRRWETAEAAALVEVVEHVDPDRLPLLERVVFAAPRLRTIVVTTPNADYNVLFETLPAGQFRHPDHRFEWSRGAFRSWAGRVSADYGWRVRLEDIGAVDPVHGAPTQMAVFTR